MYKNQKFKKFIIMPYELDKSSGIVHLNYSMDNDIKFKETINFNTDLNKLSKNHLHTLKKVLNFLSVIAGISYYKSYIPKEICAKNTPLSKEEQDFVYKIYLYGLGEFSCRNDIDLKKHLNFIFTDSKQQSTDKLQLPQRSTILIGGGKDSITSLEIMKNSNEELLTLAINPAKPIIDTIKISGISPIFIQRKLDPILFELNNSGAYNGHIPITAIVSTISLCAAIIYGFNNIIISNERSANEGNIVHNDITVNHQYSKSMEFELDFNNFINNNITPSISYFSLLRPLSELHIARLFLQKNNYDNIFTSCNRAFKINKNEKDSSKLWCCECPKCRFVFLIMATFTNPERLINIFGKNLLDDISQLDDYKQLCGLSGHKPWECVGELQESAAAIYQLSKNKNWQNSKIIKIIKNDIKEKYPDIETIWNKLLTASKHHNIPKKYLQILEDIIGTIQ